MTLVRWRAYRTQQFEDDALHLYLDAATVARWERNIERHPLIGRPVRQSGGLSLRDYEVERHVVCYLVREAAREIEMMTIRPQHEPGDFGAGLVAAAWGVLVRQARRAAGLPPAEEE